MLSFFENIFPFKDSEIKKNDSNNILQDVNHMNFFDIEYPEIPNDDERVENDLNKENKSQSDSSSSSMSSSNHNTVDFPVDNPRNDVDSSDEFVPTQNEGLPLLKKCVGQKERIDYEETFSHVVKMATVRCLLNIVVSMSWHVYQLDVNNAFLYGDLEEVVYMKPPKGYFPSDNKAYRLRKSLYGLKQAPRQWNAKLTSTLIENGFSQNLGKLKYFFGIEEIDTDKGICFNKRKYVLDLLSEYGMLACKPAKTPLMSKLVIANEACDNDPLLENSVMHSPLTFHLRIAFKILRYLKSCPCLGIHIAKTSGMFLNAYSDADWAKCIVTRKSVTGYCVFLNNFLVFKKSKKQNTLSKSSTEAEYRALALVTSEVIWILEILKDLQIENLLHVSLHCDKKVLKGVVKTVKVDSTNQIADILTKGLDTIRHSELVKRLGMHDVYHVETKEDIEIYSLNETDEDRQTQIHQTVEALVDDRQYHYETARLLDQEALVSREAWAHSMGLSSAVHYELQGYRTHTWMQDHRINAQESQIAALTAQVSSLQGHLAMALGEIRALQAREQARAGAPEGTGSSS
ncbi:ribonuclease H-like domain-containing protein [Tanacetum coccineum]